MRGKTNAYDLYFTDIIIDAGNESLLESDFTASNGLTYQYYQDTLGTWELAILTSGRIIFNKNLSIDGWFVGGGANGQDGIINVSSDTYWNDSGGKGGNGGQCVYSQFFITANTPYDIIIGDSSNDTSGFGIIAATGEGYKGGQGGCSNLNSEANGTPAGAGTSSLFYAFYDQGSSYFYPNIKFGAGGGGGRGRGRNGNNYYNNTSGSTSGGATGGGTGGGCNPVENGTNGADHYGAGGGGGGAAAYTKGLGGSGGTGIIILHPSDFEYWYLTGFFANGVWDTNVIGSWALRNSGSNSGWSTGGSCNIINNKLVIGTTSGGNHASVYGTENQINLTNYNTLNIKVTNRSNGTSTDTNNVKLALSSSKTVSNWNPGSAGDGAPTGVVSGKYVNLTGNGQFSIDISNLSTSYYIWITSASHSQVLTTIERIWFE